MSVSDKLMLDYILYLVESSKVWNLKKDPTWTPRPPAARRPHAVTLKGGHFLFPIRESTSLSDTR